MTIQVGSRGYVFLAQVISFSRDRSQFFEIATGPPSPRKKRKVSPHSDEDEPATLTQDGYADAMPGYHEHKEEEDTDQTHGAAAVDERLAGAAPKHAGNVDSEPSEPHAGTNQSASSSNVDTGTVVQPQTCPICSKTMQTDNRGLNAHVDFCLSKGAIREAQAMASVSSTKLKPSASSTSASKKGGSSSSRSRKKRKR